MFKKISVSDPARRQAALSLITTAAPSKKKKEEGASYKAEVRNDGTYWEIGLPQAEMAGKSVTIGF